MSRYRFTCGTLTLGVLIVLLTGPAAWAQSEAWKQKLNNNHVIALQKAGGSPADEGTLTIDYYGHAAFRITSPKGVVMMFDPWRNDPSGAFGLWFRTEFPKTPVDMVLSTHAHFDHDAVYAPQSPMVLDRVAGDFALADVRVTGLADKHTCIAPGTVDWTAFMDEIGQPGCPPDNWGHLDNTIFVVETAGLKTIVWGDNRHNPSPEVWAALEGADILIIPIDGSQHLLSYAQIDEITARIGPKAVIPAHYHTQGATSVISTLGNADEWVDGRENSRKLDGPSISLTTDAVKDMSDQVLYFGAHHLTE
ncbi:MAG: MBL fold metallo-hydrolase [Rhodospirillales bacterium]|nr:MBL fold metallo-hydrolase [Rhodospirillales bacterium]